MFGDLNPICIYGTGFRAKILYHFLVKRGKNVHAFVTTQKEDGDFLYGKPVKLIWDLVKTSDLSEFFFVIAVQEGYWTEIKKVLKVLGVAPEKVYCSEWRSILADEKMTKDLIDETEVYKKMQDEKSRTIWGQGVKYRLTKDYSYFLDCMGQFFNEEDSLKQGNFLSLAEWFQNAGHKSGKRIGMYAPSNFWVDFSYPRLREMGIPIDCICMDDEKLCNRLVYGVPIVSLTRMAEYLKDGWLIVGSGMKQFAQETENILLSQGFSEANVVLPCSELQPFVFGKQYFDLEELKQDEEEVFVDAGCLDCTTDIDFIEWCNGDYKHIYAFEPDKKSYEKCLDIVKEKEIQNITVVNKGLWDCKTNLGFSTNNNLALSKIADRGEDEIETIALDEYLKGEKVTFIKMDIEGAELAALKGAENTIKTYKPKLAISIYHKINDFIDIPEYLLSIVPEYKFWVRHYSCYKFETILYAMI